MIDRIRFKNFKCLADVTLDLGRFTVLVGCNGCGKTAVLEGLHLLSQTGIPVPGAPQHAVRYGRRSSIYAGPPGRILHRGRAGELALAARHTSGDELSLVAHVAAQLGADEPGTTLLDVMIGPEAPLRCRVPPPDSTAAGWGRVYAVLDHPRVVRFADAVFLPTDPALGPDDDGLASALGWMAAHDPDELARLADDLRPFAPGTKRIQLQPIEPFGHELAIAFDDGSTVAAEHLGKGALRALGILTALRQRPRPRLLLLDDLDAGLHVAAQVQLVELLLRQLAADPELQVVCSTYSPYLLDLVDPSEVRVLALDAERRTHARPLVAHPEVETWPVGTLSGELWEALGEAWVVPASASSA